MGSDFPWCAGVRRIGHFNPRSPCGERRQCRKEAKCRHYFNPRSPCGERPLVRTGTRHCPYFNPRSPCGERRERLQGFPDDWTFQSALPVWGATDRFFSKSCHISDFNPRSPCGERHRRRRRASRTRCYFNPRSPCGERLQNARKLLEEVKFQSALPVWGATNMALAGANTALFQSALPVWGATASKNKADISTLFQSALPVWGATKSRCQSWLSRTYFNPRSPCGERPLHFVAHGQYNLLIVLSKFKLRKIAYT